MTTTLEHDHAYAHPKKAKPPGSVTSTSPPIQLPTATLEHDHAYAYQKKAKPSGSVTSTSPPIQLTSLEHQYQKNCPTNDFPQNHTSYADKLKSTTFPTYIPNTNGDAALQNIPSVSYADKAEAPSNTVVTNINASPPLDKTANLEKIVDKDGFITISGNTFQVSDVPGDGNCFFHCISLAIHGHIYRHQFYRKYICQTIYDNWQQWYHSVAISHDFEHVTPDLYLRNMILGNGWATSCEIQAACYCLESNIVTWLQGTKYNPTSKSYNVTYINETHYADIPNPNTITLLLNHNHFKLLSKATAAPQNVPSVNVTQNDNQIKAKQHAKSATVCNEKQSHKRKALKFSETPRNFANQKSHTNKYQMQKNIQPEHPATSNNLPVTNSHLMNNENPSTNMQVTDEPTTQLVSTTQEIESGLDKTCEKIFSLQERCRTLGIPRRLPKLNATRHELNLLKCSMERAIKKKIDMLEPHMDVHNLPYPHPLTFDQQFNTAMDAIRAFELEQMSYSFKLCHICQEYRLNMKLAPKSKTICHRCFKDKQIIKMFSSQNKMDPGNVPDELHGLTIVEQQLISKISPTINVHMLKHGGIAANGHCVAFPQAVNELSQILPQLPEEINIIRVRKQGKNDTTKDFNVRRYVVQYALIWLQTNNPAYADIIISQARLNQLPIDGQLHIHTVEYHANTKHKDDQGPAPQQMDGDVIDDGETTSGVLLQEPTIDIHLQVENTVKSVIGEGHGHVSINKKGIITIPWPTRHATPISEFTSRYFFTMAFPCLFPYGTGDFHTNRPRTCESMSQWAEHLLWYRDGRFAQHNFFKFIVHNIISRKRVLEQSSYIVKQQLGDEQLTINDLKAELQKGNDSAGQKFLYFGATLRGSAQYWTQKAKELRSLIQYKINSGDGLPSIFSTGSCAEFYFKPFKRLLELYMLQVSGSHVDLSNRNEMFKVLQANTHVISHYFDLRTQSYFKQVMGPVFGVDCYWYRYEFAKSRGMVHWHGLCWRSDREPHNLLYESVQNNLSDSDTAQELSNWAKSVFGLTACHPAGKDTSGIPRKNLWPPPEGTAPAPPDENNPLVKLLMDLHQSQASLLEDHLLLTNMINLHRCSDYCLRVPHKDTNKTCRNVAKTCRMGFGTDISPGRELRPMPAIIKDNNRSLRLEMERDHPMLVQHSQYHTQAWRANGDISIILSKSKPENPSVDEIIATEKYVCGYASKGNEPTGATIDLYKDMLNSADESTGATAKSLCTKLLMQTVKRDISSVEASFELSFLPLYRCSHNFQSINMSGSRLLERTGSTVTKSTPLDRYLDRHKDDKCSWYTFISKQGKVPVISGGNIRATSPLTEEYCRTMLLLHWPNWRAISDVKPAESTWIQQMHDFLVSSACPNFVKADVERANRYTNTEVDDTDNDAPLDNEEIQQPDWMDIIQPNAVFDDFSNEFQYDNGGPEYNWGLAASKYNIDIALKWMKRLEEEKEKNMTEDVIQLPNVSLSSLNPEQRFAFNLVLKTLIHYKQDPQNYHPLRLIVGGTAGSGKSYLINCLVRTIRIMFQKTTAVQVLCPTGNSAHLISGVTLHSFLKIPTQSKATREMSPPDGSVGETLQKNCEGLLALLVDERSLIGCSTLGWMEFMCKCRVNHGCNSSQLWGGIPVVIFLGDDIQLPPVCDCPVYNCKSKTPAALHGSLVWKDFDSAVMLKSMVRQSNDQDTFKTALLSLREYKLDPSQAHWLQNYQWNTLEASHGEQLLQRMRADGLFVFPTHRDEWEHNKEQILAANTYTPIAKIDAMATGIHSVSASSDKACGLIRTLYLCNGAKVMLTSNILVKYGLFNGSMGTIIDIIYLDGRNSHDSLPDVVMVNFCKYTGPAFMDDHPHLVPIVPIKRKIDCNCHGCSRKQMPLRLGWGTTIHRCQGMTIGINEQNRYIVINPGSKSFESRNPGALFVALSRARTAGNPGTDPDFAWNPHILVNEDRLCHVVNTPTTRARRSEIQRLNRLAEETKQRFSEYDSDDVFAMYLNVLGEDVPFPISEE